MDSPLTLVRRLRAEPRRRVVVDAAATALVGVLLISVGLVDLITGAPWSLPGWAQNPWWHAVPLVLGCLALLLKERRPLTTLALVLPLLGLDIVLGASVGMYVVLLDSLYCLVVHGQRRWLRAVVTTIAVLIGVLSALTFVATGDIQLTALVLLQLFALLATPVWWGLSVRQHADLAELARARADDLQRLDSLRRERAVRDERARMAQDLHDALSSHLSTIAIHSQVASRRNAAPASTAGSVGACGGRVGAAPKATEAVGESLREIRVASVRALEDLREMILLLRTGEDHIVPAASLSELDSLVATARGTGLSVQVSGDPDSLPPLPSVVDQAAYRIVQEALANAAKHAPGSAVTLTVMPRATSLEVAVVSRPGQGSGRHTESSAVTGSGLGLQTMGDRARTLGGDFTAGPQEDGSWVVRAVLPLTEVLVG